MSFFNPGFGGSDRSERGISTKAASGDLNESKMSYDESVPELTVQEALDILVAWDHVKREAKLEEANEEFKKATASGNRVLAGHVIHKVVTNTLYKEKLDKIASHRRMETAVQHGRTEIGQKGKDETTDADFLLLENPGDESTMMEKAPVEVKKTCDDVVQLMAKAKICE